MQATEPVVCAGIAARDTLCAALSPELSPHHALVGERSVFTPTHAYLGEDMQTDSPVSVHTPVPEGRGSGVDMDTSPMPLPRSCKKPWKKPRRRADAEMAFDDDADFIWTSGENFKFDHAGGERCDSPTMGDGRLSLGMLDLRYACRTSWLSN